MEYVIVRRNKQPIASQLRDSIFKRMICNMHYIYIKNFNIMKSSYALILLNVINDAILSSLGSITKTDIPHQAGKKINIKCGALH